MTVAHELEGASGSGKITIKDVARRAGVARATVSQTLSGKRPVAAETRERVLEAVRDLGYHPNATARNLALRKTRTVCLSLPLDRPDGTLPEGPFFQFIAGAAERLGAADYKLLCLISRKSQTDDVIRLARSGQVDGMLLLQVRRVDPRVSALQAAGLPFVSIGRPRDHAGVVRVDADITTAAIAAVDHLHALGHRSIALTTTYQDGAPLYGFQYYALTGFRHAHHAHGLPFHHEQVLSYHPGDDPRTALQPLIGDVQGFPRDCTALITTTDYEAVLALNLLSAHGRRVPTDFSIVTLSESALTTFAQPTFTTVSFSAPDETMLAVDLLIAMMAGQSPRVQEHIIPVALVVGGTCGPAPARSCS